MLERRDIYEYWSHAAAYLPMSDYRFSLPRMQAFADGERHWFGPEPKLMKDVLDRIGSEGPLQARDFEFKRDGRIGMWDWKPAKQALEQLFMEGKLMTLRRQGFHKVYDLTERVLPSEVDTSMPTEQEYGHFLVTRYLRANGPGQASEIAYLRAGMKPVVERVMAEMLEQGEIIPLSIKSKLYFALPSSLQLLNRTLSRKRLRILSPFDNLLIQRKRMQHFFDFDYQLECYVPAQKRKYGYFCLPVLWNGRLVARLDCKAERKGKMLLIRNLVTELTVRDKGRLVDSLVNELIHFAAFNQCDAIRVGKLPDKALQALLVTVFHH